MGMFFELLLPGNECVPLAHVYGPENCFSVLACVI